MKFLSGCLGYQKFWYHEYILIIRGSEILNTFLYCLWIKNLESSALFGGSEILNLLCFLGVRNSESSPVLFGGSEILNFLCCFGVRNCESPPVFLSGISWGIRHSDSTPVVFGRSEILNALLCFCRGWDLVMNFRLYSLGIKKYRILVLFLWATSRDKKLRKSFSCLNL